MTSPDGFIPPSGGGGASDTKGVADWLGGGMGGIFGSLGQRVEEIRDGQLDLTNRTDLLSPLLDYGSAYAGSTGGIFNAGQVSFNNPVGPFQNCRLSGGRFILQDQGVWDLRARLYFDFINILGGNVKWELRVLRPDGSIFSRQYDQFNSQGIESREINTSVTVPAAGYQVQVSITDIAVLRGSLAGPAYNRLTVQHITRDTSFPIGN